MNRWYVGAALLATLTAGVHLLAGGMDVALPLLQSGLEIQLKLTLYVVWHIVSALLVFSATALWCAAMPRFTEPGRMLVLFIAVLWCVSGCLFIVVALRFNASLLTDLPQWLLLLPTSILAVAGARQGR